MLRDSGSTTTEEIRPAVSAGPRSFYPSNPGELRGQLDQIFGRVRIGDAKKFEPIAIIAPHAGYIFSGRTAAHGYKLLEGRHYDRVILLGPSHFSAFPGASIFNGRAFGTPLGEVPIDRAFVHALRARSKDFHYFAEAERREHSLEVQLPFLQHLLADGFMIVPILLYDRGYENCKQVAEAIHLALEGDSAKTLVIASSDLFHGAGADHCKWKSEMVARAVEEWDPKAFCEHIEADDFMACGAGPIAAVMMLAKSMGAKHAKVLDLTTSYEVYPASEEYVVGYLSAVYY